jgi:TolB-like protein
VNTILRARGTSPLALAGSTQRAVARARRRARYAAFSARMRAAALRAGVAVAWLALIGASLARAQVRGTIVGPGETAFPIAISPLAGSGGDACTSRFVGTLARDLDLSGLFRVLEGGAASAPNAGTGTVDYAAWASTGARMLVSGTCMLDGEGVTIEARLHDVAEQRQLGGKRYQGERRDVRRMANRFADEIMRLVTGERGPFDTRSPSCRRAPVAPKRSSTWGSTARTFASSPRTGRSTSRRAGHRTIARSSSRPSATVAPSSTRWTSPAVASASCSKGRA